MQNDDGGGGDGEDDEDNNNNNIKYLLVLYIDLRHHITVKFCPLTEDLTPLCTKCLSVSAE
jgi:hypothetical protein